LNELRQDYLTGDWVAISTARAGRPVVGAGDVCPFCPGNEFMTPPTIYRSGAVRVFENKYPALAEDVPEGYGIHEVLVDTDIHERQLHELPSEQISEIFFALQKRLADLRGHKRIKYVQVFKNQGRTGGATIAHSHWQILAMPVIPPRQRRICRSFAGYFRKHGCCFLCEFFKEQAYIVYENDGAVAYVPAASPFADSISIAPKRHVPDITLLTPGDCDFLADALKRAIKAIRGLHPECGYNICLQNGTGAASHMYMQIIPRRGTLAGFELATGCFINQTDPAESAAKLRRIVSAI
jgi:UDPglucose--hexose-1-phosphate uridylyltransferase